MGPTNLALVKLFKADQKLREAQGRLDATTKNVRIQERRVRDLTERITAAQAKLREQQAHAGTLDVDLKSRDAHIEKLRTQQQSAKNNKEYQAFLVEIATSKVDRNKVEEDAIKVMEGNEKLAAELKELQAQLQGEQGKAAAMKSQITEQTAALQAEIDSIKPEREQAAQAVPRQAREAFDRLGDRFEGEAMSPLIKPDKRREEYACSACMMDLVRDVYNKLHTRDELVFCPSCRRILYIPEDLPVEEAVHKPKIRKERPQKAPPASAGRQTSAVDILRSVTPESDEGEATGPGGVPLAQQREAAAAAAESESQSSEEPAASDQSPDATAEHQQPQPSSQDPSAEQPAEESTPPHS
jgi:predicted  nucleic acid-binding Zn-ribbon protein